MDIEMTNPALTPLLFGLGYVAVTAVRSVWLWRSDGINPYVIDHSDPTHRFVAHVFGTVVVGLFLYFGASAYWPAFERSAGLLAWASGPATRWGSIALMTLATMWTAYAQFGMGNSWRIGIPQGDAPPLRTGRSFTVSRNPIFLGMLMFVLGMTLWSPSAVTIALFVATFIALEVQIRGEEVYLERMHGDAYRAYRARVRRWI